MSFQELNPFQSIPMSKMQRLERDESQSDFDSQILFNLIRQEQQQSGYLQVVNDESFAKFRNYAQRIDFQPFQDKYREDYTLQPNMLSVKLQTFKFLEIAILNFKNDDQSFSYYAQCAMNMAFKINNFCVLAILEDYHQKNKDLIKKWQQRALEFEFQINQTLQWRIDLITASSYYHYFVDSHFSDLYEFYKDDVDAIHNAMVYAYMQYRWSSLSIAMGCLAYLLQEYEVEFEYLKYIITYYQKQQHDIFNEEEILEVRQYVFDLLSEEDGQEQEEYTNDEEEENNGDQNNSSPIQEQNMEAHQASSDTESEGCRESRSNRLQSVSSQTTIYTQSSQSTYNKKRSATGYKLQSNENNDYEKPTETKNRCMSQQLIKTSSSIYQYEEYEIDQFEVQSKKKVKTSTNIIL